MALIQESALRWVGRWGRAARWLEGSWVRRGGGRPLRVADIGCAFGFGAARLASTGAWVVGVEPDEAYVRRARGTYPGIAFVRASATSLPFLPGQVDAFTMLDVLEHVGADGMAHPQSPAPSLPVATGEGCTASPDLQSCSPPPIPRTKPPRCDGRGVYRLAGAQGVAIREAARVLRPGGIGVLTVPASGPGAVLDSLNRYESLRRHMPAWLPLDPTEVATGSLHLHFSEGDLRWLLGEAGMEVVRASRSGTGVIAELVHLAILVATRGFARSESAYRWLRLIYFVVHVLDDAIPLPRFGYSLAVLARRNP